MWAEEVHVMSATKLCKKLFQIEKNKISMQKQGTEGQVSCRALVLSDGKRSNWKEKQLVFSSNEVMPYTGNLDKRKRSQ